MSVPSPSTRHLPPEWHQQAATWLSWPHNKETWPENLAAAQTEFVTLARTIAKHQPVKILCIGEPKRQAKIAFAGEANIELVDIPTNDAWARDYAPTFVIQHEGSSQLKELVAINWHYNAWGGKYPPLDDDQVAAARIASRLDIKCDSPDLCFEGGAIEINESGILLSTRSCALDPNRNPNKTLQDIENIFATYLGAKQTIWLAGNAIEGDDTDGHIDQLARFTDDQTIVYAWCKESDSQFSGLAKNLSDLKTGLKKLERSHHRLIALPIPDPKVHCGRQIPMSYCNFLICNDAVLVPQFGSPMHDDNAIAILKPLFPDRDVIGLDSLNLAVGLGSFHCLSQQQPEITQHTRSIQNENKSPT